MHRSTITALSAIALLSLPLPAQTYWVGVGIDGVGAACADSRGSSTLAQVSESCGAQNGLPGLTFNGWARSSAYALEASSEISYQTTQGAPRNGYARPRWSFDDVVFSDGLPGSQPITVQMSFTMSGTAQWGGGTGPGSCRLTVNQGSFNWQTGNLLPGSAVSIVTPSFTVFTNTPTSIGVSLTCDSRGGGPPQFSKTTCVVTWGDQSESSASGTPFLVPAGITVNSAQAQIANNTAVATASAISPTVQASDPTVAGSNTTVSFSGGQAGSLGAYLFGLPPAAINIPITTWFTLDLPPAPLIAVPFAADASGNASRTFPVDAALSGASLGVQAVQVYQGPPNEAYGTNAWLIDIQ